MDVIDYLRQKQAALGESDSAFARRLGVPRSNWHRWSRRQRKGREPLVQAALAAFPEDYDRIVALRYPRRAAGAAA